MNIQLSSPRALRQSIILLCSITYFAKYTRKPTFTCTCILQVQNCTCTCFWPMKIPSINLKGWFLDSSRRELSDDMSFPIFLLNGHIAKKLSKYMYIFVAHMYMFFTNKKIWSTLNDRLRFFWPKAYMKSIIWPCYCRYLLIICINAELHVHFYVKKHEFTCFCPIRMHLIKLKTQFLYFSL